MLMTQILVAYHPPFNFYSILTLHTTSSKPYPNTSHKVAEVMKLVVKMVQLVTLCLSFTSKSMQSFHRVLEVAKS